MELVHFLTDVEALVRWGGYLGLSLIVFTETGLMIGFFLPGDSLLVTAGLFAAQGHLDIVVLNLLLITMAIAGDATGYLIGRALGPKLFDRPSSRLFRREHLIRTRLYYEMHGGKTIVIARFVPVLRTFAPVVAGIARMDYRRFAFFNIIGGIGWVTSMTLLGFGLGRLIPGISQSIEIVILIVVFVSLIPVFVDRWSASRKSRLHRTSFNRFTRSVLHSLREIRLDWSDEALHHATQILTTSHDATSIMQTEMRPLDLRVIAPRGDQSPRLEIDAPMIDYPAGGGEAAREWMTLELRNRYVETVRMASDILGCAPMTNEPACWEMENSRLLIIRREEPHTGLFRLSFVLEPLEINPTRAA